MPSKELNIAEAKVLQAIKEDPQRSAEEIAKTLGYTRSYIYPILKSLCYKGRIRDWKKVPASFEVVE